jgi:hypothetical protein
MRLYILLSVFVKTIASAPESPPPLLRARSDYNSEDRHDLSRMQREIYRNLRKDLQPIRGYDILELVGDIQRKSRNIADSMIPMSVQTSSTGSIDYIVGVFAHNHHSETPVPLYFDLSNEEISVMDDEHSQSRLGLPGYGGYVFAPSPTRSVATDTVTVDESLSFRDVDPSADEAHHWTESLVLIRTPPAEVTGAVGVLGAAPGSTFADSYPVFGLASTKDKNVLISSPVDPLVWCKDGYMRSGDISATSEEWQLQASTVQILPGNSHQPSLTTTRLTPLVIPMVYQGEVTISTDSNIGLNGFLWDAFWDSVASMAGLTAENFITDRMGRRKLPDSIITSSKFLPSISLTLSGSRHPFVVHPNDYLFREPSGWTFRIVQSYEDYPILGAPFLKRHIVQFNTINGSIGICEPAV